MAEFVSKRVSEMPEVPAANPNDLVPVSVEVTGGPSPYVSSHVKYSNFAAGLQQFQTYNEVPAGAINGTNANFLISFDPVGETLEVFVNGLLQEISPTGDLTVVGKVLHFNAGSIPQALDKIRAIYQAVP